MATIRKEQYVSTKKVVKRKRDCRKENTKRDVQRAVDHWTRSVHGRAPYILAYMNTDGNVITAHSGCQVPENLESYFNRPVLKPASVAVAAKDPIQHPLITWDKLQHMCVDEMKKIIPEIVCGKGKGCRSTWGYETKKPVWWPDHLPTEHGGQPIPFVAPSSRNMKKTMNHTKKTLQTVLYSYIAYYTNEEEEQEEERTEDESREQHGMEMEEVNEGDVNGVRSERRPTVIRAGSPAEVEDEEEVVERSESQRSYWVVAGINIYPSDLESLGVNKEITDSIVDACIMNQVRGRNLVTPHYSHWSIRGQSEGSIQIQKSKYYMFPTCMHSHWWLMVLYISERGTACIYHLDSMWGKPYSGERHHDAANQLRSVLGIECACMNVPRVAQQGIGTNDCGLHVIFNAWKLLKIGSRSMKEMNKKMTLSREEVKQYLKYHKK